jgi:ParB family transcriptional regulator, chromosome partitioning protein
MEHKEEISTMSMQEKLKGKFQHVMPSDAQRMFLAELSKIRPNPDQPRKSFDEESLQELARSIEEYGQLMPIILKRGEESGNYILAAGERRYRAHKLLGKTHIYAVLTEGGLDEIGLIENIQREDLHPLELAESLQRLMEKHSWNQDQLGQAIGKNRRTVNETLLLNKLPEDIKEECRTSGITVPKSVLIQIARLERLDQQLTFWRQAKEGALTVREVRVQRKAEVPKIPASPAKQLLASGRGFTKRLKELSSSTLNEAELYELIELRKEIDTLIEEIRLSQIQ